MPGRRKDVMVYHYDPKKRFFLVTLQLENVPGALGNITSILGVRGINMLEGYFGGISGEGKGTMSFFVESANPKMDKGWLLDFIKSAVLVSNVEIKEGVEGFLSDSLNFPLTWNNGDRAIVLRMETAQTMLDEIRAVAGAEVVYKAGLKHGTAGWSDVFSHFRPKTQEGLTEVLHILDAVGWGVFNLHSVDFNRKTAVIRYTEGFECAGVSSAEPYSQFIRGHVAGCMTALFGTDIKVVESKCVSTGDRYCEFVCGPPSMS